MADDTFTLLPLHLDPQTKALSTPTMPDSQTLQAELAALNNTHRALLSVDSPNGVPPPPIPLNPKRSAAIQKMREQGNAALARRNAGGAPPQEHVKESVKLYTYAIDMALGRPPWEPAQIVRDELGVLLSNRAQSYIGLQAWPEAMVDAETSIECKPAPGQGKAWWRRGRSLLEMGRLEEAQEVVMKAQELEGADGGQELKTLKEEIESKIERR